MQNVTLTIFLCSFQAISEDLDKKLVALESVQASAEELLRQGVVDESSARGNEFRFANMKKD